MGRPIKYEDESHRKNREKVARHRARNRVKMIEQLESARQQTIINKGLRKPWGSIVYDIVDENGQVVDVQVRYHTEPPPERGRLSDFLPHSPVDWPLAYALRRARLAQLAEWRDS